MFRSGETAYIKTKVECWSTHHFVIEVSYQRFHVADLFLISSIVTMYVRTRVYALYQITVLSDIVQMGLWRSIKHIKYGRSKTSIL